MVLMEEILVNVKWTIFDPKILHSNISESILPILVGRYFKENLVYQEWNSAIQLIFTIFCCHKCPKSGYILVGLILKFCFAILWDTCIEHS